MEYHSQENQPFFSALFALFGLFTVILAVLFFFGNSPFRAIVAGSLYLLGYGLLQGKSISELTKHILNNLKTGFKVFWVLMLIGGLISGLIFCGFIPWAIFYGSKLISINYFLPSCLFITIIMSSISGSSLTTGGSLGVPLLAIGLQFGYGKEQIIGAIICGCFFGDKMSPLSDTTNFAPGILGIDIFEHVKCLWTTTIPSILITFAAFFFMSHSGTTGSYGGLLSLQEKLQQAFNLSPWSLLPGAVIFIMAFRKMPTILVLCCGIGASIIIATLTQTPQSFMNYLKYVLFGVQFESLDPELIPLINRGGISSMLSSVGLVAVAFVLGGLINGTKMIQGLIEKVQHMKLRPFQAVHLAALFCVLVNLTTGEQYLSILLPGQNFRLIFEKLNIPKKILARTLEDAGTLINPLVPWGVCGAFFSEIFDSSVWDFAPYCVFLYASFFMTLLLSWKDFRTT